MFVFAPAPFDGVEAINTPAGMHASTLLDSLLPTTLLNSPVRLCVHVYASQSQDTDSNKGSLRSGQVLPQIQCGACATTSGM